ncbi:MAG: ATP-dependent helicase [Gemmatimonadaceae bacterium]
MSAPHATTEIAADVGRVAHLNPAQREAVEHFEGPLLILAGAGSGKTRVLTSRIAWLIEQQGVDPAHILAVTFTNKAAGEMRERVARALGETPAGMWIGTFHSIGARMLRREAAAVGRAAAFTIYDEDDTLSVMRRVMDRLRISTKQWSPRIMRAAISDAKNGLVGPEEYAALAMDPMSKAAAQLYAPFDAALREANAVDFDDLLVLPVRVLLDRRDRLADYRARFQFILVDEYQDTNRAQYKLVTLLGGEHGNVCVVGDDDQSIYGWRGADIRNILDFEKDFPAARVVRLEDNYRSTPQVLDLANVVISANLGRRGKTLRPTREGGERVTVTGCLDERDESEWLAEEIAGRRSAQPELTLRDIAVLYRTNSQSRALEESLRRHGLPYRIIGAVRFYDRREIRDLMSYLKLIANPADDQAFLRAIGVPRRGLGEATLEQLGDVARAAGMSLLDVASRPERLESLRSAARQALADFSSLVHRYRARAVELSVDELLRDLVEEIGYAADLRKEPDGADRLDNVRELIAGAEETVADEGGELGLTPLDHFLQRASLIADIDRDDPAADAVLLMTLHNAKGLEFPVVFITGLEEGLFPLSRAHDEPEMLEEERRLFYVGITRAERKLYLTHARSRRRNGETMPSIPSSFLATVPPGMLEERATLRLRATGRGVMPQSPSARRPGRPVTRSGFAFDPDEDASQDAPRFVKGERVRHARFGSGTVVELGGTGRDMKVTVDFDDESIGRKRLVVAYAGLQRGFE